MNVKDITGENSLCDAFVAGRADGRICHLTTWSEAVERGLDNKVYYLVAHEDDEVHGVLPLMHVKSRMFGNRMVSHALSDYGGILADCDQARDALYCRAGKLAGELGAESIEFRNVEPLPYDGLHTRTDKIGARLELKPAPEEIWSCFTSKSRIRNHIRRGQKAGLTIDVGGVELLDEFYDLYTLRMAQLGTPCYSRRVIRLLLECLPGNCRLFISRLGTEPVAVTLTFCFNGNVESSLGVTAVKYNSLSPNHFLFWEVMKYYCYAGARWFEFGRSTIGSSGHQFKKQWLSEPMKLHYQYWVHPGTELSVASPDSPKYRRKVEMWKRLPAWATRILGPMISRNLP